MDSLLNRYRNITVLLLVLFAQLLLLAVQVRNDQDVRMIRVWAVTAVTPLARVLDGLRSGTFGFVQDYVTLHDAREENKRLRSELARIKIENQFLRTELASSERAKALAAFQSRTASKMLAARVIGMGAGANSRVVFVDRGSTSGVMRGMGVVTPDGIAGKVLQAYPTASQVELVTDSDFAAGVISQKNQVRGTLKGQGAPLCRVEYVQNEQKVDPGEWFYTSGDDRIFPKGFPVGVARVVRQGEQEKEILVEPAGLQRGLEEVLILLEGVPQLIPEAQTASAPVYVAPPPPGAADAAPHPEAAKGTDADRLRERYKEIGDAQGHKFGEGLPGSKPPDFNLKLPPGGIAAKPSAAAQSGSMPPASSPGQSPPADTVKPAPEPRAPAPPKPAAEAPPKTGGRVPRPPAPDPLR